jgi:dTDP-4-amino-4,6-dideoxygalactose transaminase
VLRFHGITRLADGTRDVTVAGGKFNMSDVSARLGLAQLKHLDEWNVVRQKLAAHYFLRLRPIANEFGIVLNAAAHPGEAAGHSWNMFCVLLPLERMSMTRKQFIDAMHGQHIGIGVSYEAMHLTSLFRNKGHHEGTFPVAERIGRETVSLPLHHAMTSADVDRVCDALVKLLKR